MLLREKILTILSTEIDIRHRDGEPSFNPWFDFYTKYHIMRLIRGVVVIKIGGFW